MEPVIEGLEEYILEHGLQKRLDLNFSDFAGFNRYMALMIKKKDKLRSNELPHLDLDSSDDSSDDGEALPPLAATSYQEDSIERGTLSAIIATPEGDTATIGQTATIFASNMGSVSATPLSPAAGGQSPQQTAEVANLEQAANTVSMFDFKAVDKRTKKISLFQVNPLTQENLLADEDAGLHGMLETKAPLDINFDQSISINQKVYDEFFSQLSDQDTFRLFLAKKPEDPSEVKARVQESLRNSVKESLRNTIVAFAGLAKLKRKRIEQKQRDKYRSKKNTGEVLIVDPKINEIKDRLDANVDIKIEKAQDEWADLKAEMRKKAGARDAEESQEPEGEDMTVFGDVQDKIKFYQEAKR
jgi:hypothetical protein